jgi:membrane-associated protease RseP (regulator of RpoE activity)
MGGGAGGGFLEKEILFQSLEIAGFTLRDPLIDITLEKTGEGALRRRETVGNLGNTVLQHFVLYLDYKRQRIIVEKGEDFGREFPSDRSGLMVISSEKGEIEIYFVSPSTPAEESGFRKGDLIRSIDGKDFLPWSGVLDAREILQQSPDTELTVIVERERKRIELPLKLRDLHRPG